jgi:rhodanese-related sulfurtransferase
MHPGKSMAQRVAEAATRIPEVDAEALATMRGSEGCLHIDVREPDEWARARIPGAILVPLATVERDIAAKAFGGAISPDDLARPIVVSCAAGRRSLVGADILREMGFTAVASLRGGIEAWMHQGRPVDR